MPAHQRPSTREEHKRQLDRIKNEADGFERIFNLFVRTILDKRGISGTQGVMADQMIEEILDASWGSAQRTEDGPRRSI